MRYFEVEVRVNKNYVKELVEKIGSREEIQKNKRTLYVKSLADLSSILAPKRIELLEFLAVHPENTINKIAELLGRERTAVSKDINYLATFGLVDLDKKGREVRASARVEKLVIPIRAK